MDRNIQTFDFGALGDASLSARRAWIEIVAWLDYSEELLVALRKESVDRNNSPSKQFRPGCPSLSARRAWIEMLEKLGL